jgi:hypothetical protein
MTLKERILELIEFEKMNPNQFYNATGLGNGWIDKVGKKLKNPSIEKISKTFPKWNIDYLQTGEGDKYRINDVLSESLTSYCSKTTNKDDIIASQQKTINNLTEMLFESQQRIKEMEKKNVPGEDASVAAAK